jgi:hypothetical protein
MVELTMNGEYRGIYILSEAIKRGKDRVDIAKLKKSDCCRTQPSARR